MDLYPLVHDYAISHVWMVMRGSKEGKVHGDILSLWLTIRMQLLLFSCCCVIFAIPAMILFLEQLATHGGATSSLTQPHPEQFSSVSRGCMMK